MNSYRTHDVAIEIRTLFKDPNPVFANLFPLEIEQSSRVISLPVNVSCIYENLQVSITSKEEVISQNVLLKTFLQ